jgi:hypothetical protein
VATRRAWSISLASAKLCPANASRRNSRHHPSCRLSQQAPVGIKTWCRRGCSASQARVWALLWRDEVVRDQVELSLGIGRFDILEEGNVVGGVARRGRPGEFLPVLDPQRAIDPPFFWTTTGVERSLNTMAVGGPPGRGRKAAWDYWPEFIGTERRRPLGRLGVVGDDGGSFGAKSLPRGSAQLWMPRQRTPSRR